MTRQRSRGRKGTPRVKPVECIFRKGFVTEVIDRKIDELWKLGIGGKTPFGDLRNMWRRHHCRLLNPYGDSDRCPFDKKECAYAFLEAVQQTVHARPHTPVGYFIKVARSSGAVRADEGVERRAAAARLRRTDVHLEAAPYAYPTSAAAPPGDVPREVGTSALDGDDPRYGGRQEDDDRAGDREAGGDHLRRDVRLRPVRAALPLSGMGDGPSSLGDVLGRMEPRPREGRTPNGSEGRG